MPSSLIIIYSNFMISRCVDIPNPPPYGESPTMSDENLPQVEPPTEQSYSLPEVKDFDGVNQNFATLSDLVTQVVTQMQKQSENTNENIMRLAEETTAMVDKLTKDMKTILSSQSMILVLCVIAICFVVAIFKGLFDAFFLIF